MSDGYLEHHFDVYLKSILLYLMDNSYVDLILFVAAVKIRLLKCWLRSMLPVVLYFSPEMAYFISIPVMLGPNRDNCKVFFKIYKFNIVMYKYTRALHSEPLLGTP